MLGARFSQLYFGPSLNTLQRGLPAIAGLLVCSATAEIRSKLYFCVSVCMRVNKGGTNHNRYTYRLVKVVILHAQTYKNRKPQVAELSQKNSGAGCVSYSVIADI